MNKKNTVQADFLVATVELNSLTDEELSTFETMQIDGNLKKLYGYKGFAKEGVFVGDNGHRLLVQAAGSKANEVISLVNPKWPTLSVARLDMQITVLVGDADSIIRSTTPPPKYRAVRLVNLGERGSTLYVGSPKSRCRLRLYNKTAQLGESRVQDLEKLRIELQLRDDYADRALINMLAGTGDAFFRYYVSKMTDAYIVSIIERAFSNSNMLAMTEVRTEKSDDGRKVWLEHSVIPALMRLAVYDREYYDDFLRRLNELVD